MFPDKIKTRYEYLKLSPFEFDLRIYNPHQYFLDEAEFVAFVYLNKWFQKKIGIGKITINQGFPDFTALILNSDIKIRIEVEFDAHNFIKHGHAGCHADLILSVIRPRNSHFISGVPVWSLYERATRKVKGLPYCLPYDIAYSEDED